MKALNSAMMLLYIMEYMSLTDIAAFVLINAYQEKSRFYMLLALFLLAILIVPLIKCIRNKHFDMHLNGMITDAAGIGIFAFICSSGERFLWEKTPFLSFFLSDFIIIVILSYTNQPKDTCKRTSIIFAKIQICLSVLLLLMPVIFNNQSPTTPQNIVYIAIIILPMLTLSVSLLYHKYLPTPMGYTTSCIIIMIIITNLNSNYINNNIIMAQCYILLAICITDIIRCIPNKV